MEGRAGPAIKIRSPGDETFEKIGWYGRVGVAELLVVDRDTRAVRHWVADGPVPAETEPDGDSSFACQALPVRLRAGAGPVLKVDACERVVAI